MARTRSPRETIPISRPSPSTTAIREALRDGHIYVSHDWLCDPTGFAFGAVNNLGVFPMGDTAVMTGHTRLVGLTPLPAKLRLIRHGEVVQETAGTNLTFVPKEPGAYRLEASVDEGHLATIRAGQPVAVTLDSVDRTLDARVSEIVPAVDAASRAYTVKRSSSRSRSTA